MKRRRVVRVLTAIGFLFPVVSKAADFCDTLIGIADEAPSKFRRLKGARDMDTFYNATVSLPGATECQVEVGDGEFICRWELSVREDASSEAKTLADGIAGCFPTAKSRTSGVRKISAYEYTIRGVVFRVGIDDAKNKIRLGVERDH